MVQDQDQQVDSPGVDQSSSHSEHGQEVKRENSKGGCKNRGGHESDVCGELGFNLSKEVKG